MSKPALIVMAAICPIMGCTSTGIAPPAQISLAAEPGLAGIDKESGLTMDDFQKLEFLEGRWAGRGPDGKPFFEQYDMPEEGVLRSRRFETSEFTEATDGSEVRLTAGGIISRWLNYTWRADELTEGYIHFVPIEAPSAFSWRRISVDQIEVKQEWNDESGAPKSYVIMLERL